MDEILQSLIEYKLDIPFKEFTGGQVIQSKQFNDDMKDVEEKINEIISKYNFITNSYYAHSNNYSNPHKVTAHQTNAYTVDEIDLRFNQVQSGQIVDKSIRINQIHESVGELLDISKNSNIISISKIVDNYNNVLFTIFNDYGEDIKQNVKLFDLNFEYIYEG